MVCETGPWLPRLPLMCGCQSRARSRAIPLFTFPPPHWHTILLRFFGRLAFAWIEPKVLFSGGLLLNDSHHALNLSRKDGFCKKFSPPSSGPLQPLWRSEITLADYGLGLQLVIVNTTKFHWYELINLTCWKKIKFDTFIVFMTILPWILIVGNFQMKITYPWKKSHFEMESSYDHSIFMMWFVIIVRLSSY